MRRGPHRTARRAPAALLTVLLVAGAFLAVTSARTDEPVLGSKRFAPNGEASAP